MRKKTYYIMSLPPDLRNCQFVTPTDNSYVGRVKICLQDLRVLAAQQVNVKYLSYIYFLKDFLFYIVSNIYIYLFFD